MDGRESEIRERRSNSNTNRLTEVQCGASYGWLVLVRETSDESLRLNYGGDDGTNEYERERERERERAATKST